MAQHELVLVHESQQDVDRTLSALCQVVAADAVRVFRTPEAALEYLLQAATEAEAGSRDLPRLILIDMDSVSQGNLGLMASIRNDDRIGLLPVVVLAPPTGLPDPEALNTLRANSIIRKSMEPGRLRDNLALLVRYWMFLNVPPPPAPLAH